jgi:uncharacterized membrane protein YphA (DoxX/SURF4 family)
MGIALWIVAGLLAAIFTASAWMKVIWSRERLLTTYSWVEDFPTPAVKAIGTLELLGAIGLILPGALKIAPIMVPIAAVGVGLLMIGAGITHARRHELKEMSFTIVLLLLAAFEAYGRFGPCKFK